MVRHPWLQGELEQRLAALPAVRTPEADQPRLAHWQTREGRPCPHLPPVRGIVVWNNLAGHWSAELVIWLSHQGVLPLYPPLRGRWLTLAESLQRIRLRRALCSQHPQTPEQIIHWLEETVAGWNAAPTPLTWHGKRYERRQRARVRRHHSDWQAQE
jgi:hypothetical protein